MATPNSGFRSNDLELLAYIDNLLQRRFEPLEGKVVKLASDVEDLECRIEASNTSITGPGRQIVVTPGAAIAFASAAAAVLIALILALSGRADQIPSVVSIPLPAEAPARGN